MVINPAIIALLGGSLLTTTFAFYALATALQILRHWDLESGSDGQLILERKTYLVSTIFSYLAVFQLFSLFLFVYTAEHVHGLFVGAMCAAGTLAVNAFGYPTLALKTITFLFCGVWLIVNHADNRTTDYAMIRPKYWLLSLLTVLIGLETFFQAGYFMGLKADVITSCCGTLFSEQSAGVAGDIAGFSPHLTRIAFYVAVALTLRVGIQVLMTGKGAAALGALAAGTTVVSLVAVISFISPYYFELPTHHCPFCLLQKEYNYIGYPLYLSLFTAGISGMGAGVLDIFKGSGSLTAVIPPLQKRLSMISITALIIFTLIATWPMVFGDFVLITSP